MLYILLPHNIQCVLFMLVIFYTELSLNTSLLITVCMGKLHWWIMPLTIDHASSTWLGREEDKSQTMIDVLQEVQRCLGVERNLQLKMPRSALFYLVTSQLCICLYGTCSAQLLSTLAFPHCPPGHNPSSASHLSVATMITTTCSFNFSRIWRIYPLLF